MNESRKARRSTPRRRGGAPLLPLALVVVLLAVVLHLQRSDLDLPAWLGGSSSTDSGSTAQQRVRVLELPNPGSADLAAAEPGESPRILMPDTSTFRSPSKDDRWARAEQEAATGRARILAAEEWRVEVGGDPFYYRSEVSAGRKHYQAAVDILQAMRADYESNPSALQTLDRLLARYEQAARSPVK